MSELREQLREGRREHGGVRYPGDLAAEVLGGASVRLGYGVVARPRWVVWASAGALGGVAAMVAVVLWRGVPVGVGPLAEVAVVEPVPLRGEGEFSVVPEIVGGSLVPRGEGVVVSNESAAVVPGVPSFPSLAEVMEGAESSENIPEENT